jgi:hypothetical protein
MPNFSAEWCFNGFAIAGGFIALVGFIVLFTRGGLARPQFGKGDGPRPTGIEYWPGGNARPISQAELDRLKATHRTRVVAGDVEISKKTEVQPTKGR